jgi:hypothetical protein
MNIMHLKKNADRPLLEFQGGRKDGKRIINRRTAREYQLKY